MHKVIGTEGGEVEMETRYGDMLERAARRCGSFQQRATRTPFPTAGPQLESNAQPLRMMWQWQPRCVPPILKPKFGLCRTFCTTPADPWPMFASTWRSSCRISELASAALSRSKSRCRASAFASVELETASVSSAAPTPLSGSVLASEAASKGMPVVGETGVGILMGSMLKRFIPLCTGRALAWPASASGSCTRDKR